jgi:hypothetical protein
VNENQLAYNVDDISVIEGNKNELMVFNSSKDRDSFLELLKLNNQNNNRTLVRYKFIKDHVSVFPVGKMCEVLQVSRSGFYHWKKRKPTKRAERRAMLSSEIFIIYHWSRGRYGSGVVNFVSTQFLYSLTLML